MPLWTCSTIYHHRNFAILARNTHQHPGPQGLPLSPHLDTRPLLLLPHLLLRRPSRHGRRWSGRRKRRPLHHQQSLHQLQPHPQQHPKPLPPRRASPYGSADSSLRETAPPYPPAPSPLGTASILCYRLLSSNASSAIQQMTFYSTPWTRLKFFFFFHFIHNAGKPRAYRIIKENPATAQNKKNKRNPPHGRVPTT